MKGLLVLGLLVLVAGCAGVKTDSALFIDCMRNCVLDQPIWFIDANGDSVLIYPRDYQQWIFRSDGTVEFKDEIKAGDGTSAKRI